jgi:hypothetical protein
MGDPAVVDAMSDAEIEALAARFRMTLEQAVAFTEPSTRIVLDFDAAMKRTNELLIQEDVRDQVDEVRRLVESLRPSPGGHDNAGELAAVEARISKT